MQQIPKYNGLASLQIDPGEVDGHSDSGVLLSEVHVNITGYGEGIVRGVIEF